MASLNRIYLIGNLTRDPEIRYTPGGAAVGRLGLAVNRKYTTNQGEEREEVCFVDVETWGRQAETCEQYLHKGSPVLVEGRLKFDQWDDRETGKKRSKHLVSAERVQFLGSPTRGGGQGDDVPSEYRQRDDRPADEPRASAVESGRDHAQEPARQEPARQEPARQEPARQEPARQEPARQEPAKSDPARRDDVFNVDDEPIDDIPF